MRVHVGILIASVCAMTGACQTSPAVVSAPGQRTIEKIETEYSLLRIVEIVGVADPVSMNRAARTRIRNVRCDPPEAGQVRCAYDASQCLDVEVDQDGDGWCARRRVFIRTSGHDPASPTADGWMVALS